MSRLIKKKDVQVATLLISKRARVIRGSSLDMSSQTNEWLDIFANLPMKLELCRGKGQR